MYRALDQTTLSWVFQDISDRDASAMAVALTKRSEEKISAIFLLIMRDSATKGACKIRRDCDGGPTRIS